MFSIPCGTAIGTHYGAIYWLNYDPMGLMCGCMTYALLLFAMYTTNVYVIQPWIEVTTPLGFLNCLLFNSLCCMAGWAHFKTMTTDPGAIPRTAVPLNFHRKRNVEITVKAGARSGDVVGGISDISPSTTGSTTLNTNASSADIELGIAATAITNNLNDNCTKTMDSVSMTPQALTAKSKQAEQSEQKEYVRCKKCKYFKPPRSHHCSQCRRCITKMDHHCPWVNNCVGIGNQKLFILFLFYIALSSAYALCLIITRYFSCDRYECNVSGGIWTLFLTVESLLFGFFTCCMLVEQLDSIESEETTVERIIRQKNGNGKASGNTASNKSKVEKAKEEASGGGSPISYDIDEFVEIFGHSIYNNGPENTYFQHFRNYIQLLTPTPAQYYSIDMKDKVYCFTNRASSDFENGLENDAELGNDDTSALLKPKHF